MDIDKKIRTIKKLKEYGGIEKDILHLRNKINIIDNKITKIKTSRLDDTVNQSDGYILEKLIDDKVDLVKRLNIKYLEKDYMDSALNMIDKKDKQILVDIYCKKYTINSIASSLGYSERQVRRKRDDAIMSLSVFI